MESTITFASSSSSSGSAGNISSSNNNNLMVMVATTTGIAAAMLAIALPLLQTDYMARRCCGTWLLSSRGLQAKRNAQYQYRWRHALEKTLYYLYHVYFAEEDGVVLDWLTTDEELRTLLQETGVLQHTTGTSTSTTAPLRVLWIGVDVDHDDPRGEYYLYLLQKQPISTSPPPPPPTNGDDSSSGRHNHHRRRLIKVPLVAFGLALHEAMERQVTTTTFCFVADASSGLGTRWITGLLQSANTGVVVFQEPLWMATLAFLAQQRLISTDKLERILFGLCRLEAWRVRDQLGDAKTVVFTLPGQGAVPILLPLVQAAFPEDRHVFCYDGCVASVERAIALSSSSSLQQQQKKQQPTTLEALLQWNYHPLVSIGTPIHPTKLPNSIPALIETSRQLPLPLASATHAWMDSVDTFLQLQAAASSNNNSNSSSKNNKKSSKSSPQVPTYLPYVCKMSLLLPTAATTDNSNKDDNVSPSQDVMYSLSSLLQYMTGYHFKSRPLPPHVWEAALDYWRSTSNHSNSTTLARGSSLSFAQQRAVEDCVFRHKSILIGDKTLPDTVLPAQHWTLKQASKKSGCACCGPELDDDDDEENENNKSNNASLPFGLLPKTEDGSAMEPGSSTRDGLVQRKRPKFVDGKTAFAFDPSAFSM